MQSADHDLKEPGRKRAQARLAAFLVLLALVMFTTMVFLLIRLGRDGAMQSSFDLPQLLYWVVVCFGSAVLVAVVFDKCIRPQRSTRLQTLR